MNQLALVLILTLARLYSMDVCDSFACQKEISDEAVNFDPDHAGLSCRL